MPPRRSEETGSDVGNSTPYTIGTVLNHARDVDRFGVVLAADGDQHAVVRMEAISAVKIT